MDGIFQKQHTLIQQWGKKWGKTRGLTLNTDAPQYIGVSPRNLEIISSWKAPTLGELIRNNTLYRDSRPRKCYKLIVDNDKEDEPNLKMLGVLNEWVYDTNTAETVGRFTHGVVRQYVTAADWPSVKPNPNGMTTTENRFVECLGTAGGYRKSLRRGRGRGHSRSKRKSRRT